MAMGPFRQTVEFVLRYEPQPLQLTRVFQTGSHKVNAGRLNTGMAQYVS